MKSSIRRQLIFLNIGVVAASSLVLGTILVVENQRRGYERVDRELRDRVRPFTDGRAEEFPAGRFFGTRGGSGGPPGPDRGNGPGEGRGPDGSRGPDGRGPDGRGPDGPPGRGGPIGPDDPFFRFRRALLISSVGTVLAPDDATEPYDPSSAKRALGASDVWSTIRFGNDRIRVLSVPWTDPARGPAVIQVARDLREVEAFENSLRMTFLWGLPLILLVAGAGALFLVNRALNPVERVTREAARISADNLSERLTILHDDEIGRLASTFNQLIGRLQISFDEQRVLAERQRQFTADASHELRTPLTRLRLATSAGLLAKDANGAHEALTVADQAAASMDRLVQQLLILSRADATELPVKPERQDLRVTVAEALMMVPGSDRILVDLPEEPVYAMVDRDITQRVTINLAENALKYAPSPAEIRLQVKPGQIIVSDTGPGMSPDEVARIGERFFRADSARTSGGVGLGLSIVKALLSAHHGHLEVQSSVGKGTVFTAHIPDFPVQIGTS
jgi:signal transduction histidine kinase